MSTAPQRERSDRPNVTRGWREQCQNSKYATARAIWQAQSEERVAWAISNHKQRKRSDANETTTGVHGRPRNSHRATTRAAWATHATRGSGVAHVISFHKTLRPPWRINIEKVAFLSKLENWQGSSLVWNQKISVQSCWFPWKENSILADNTMTLQQRPSGQIRIIRTSSEWCVRFGACVLVVLQGAAAKCWFRVLWSLPTGSAGCRCRVSLQSLCFFRVLLSECCVRFGADLLVLLQGTGAGYYCQRAVCILGTWVLLQGAAVRVRCALWSLGTGIAGVI